MTSVLTWSALPDPEKLSASSRFFGALAAIAAFTAAMNLALSNPAGLAPLILSAWAALAWASLSPVGATAAADAFFASPAAGGWALSPLALAPTWDSTLANRGSSWGSIGVGAGGGDGDPPDPSARRCTTGSPAGAVTVPAAAGAGPAGPAGARSALGARAPATSRATAALPALRWSRMTPRRVSVRRSGAGLGAASRVAARGRDGSPALAPSRSAVARISRSMRAAPAGRQRSRRGRPGNEPAPSGNVRR